ncbi:hypothetical protein BGW80DRAFT_1339953 [Lactifluus volemus]|nr:hypothetical protein BGW80DRAFT_1339953 [Lactifluus volemus]
MDREMMAQVSYNPIYFCSSLVDHPICHHNFGRHHLLFIRPVQCPFFSNTRPFLLRMTFRSTTRQRRLAASLPSRPRSAKL